MLDAPVPFFPSAAFSSNSDAGTREKGDGTGTEGEGQLRRVQPRCNYHTQRTSRAVTQPDLLRRSMRGTTSQGYICELILPLWRRSRLIGGLGTLPLEACETAGRRGLPSPGDGRDLQCAALRGVRYSAAESEVVPLSGGDRLTEVRIVKQRRLISTRPDVAHAELFARRADAAGAIARERRRDVL